MNTRLARARASPNCRQAELRLEVSGIIDGIGRYVPVLHLHGRVGWYRRDQRVYVANVIKHDQGFGVPIVMLPDPDKVYDQDDIIISRFTEEGGWPQFGLPPDSRMACSPIVS
jgi:hypothetical protein